MYPDRGPTTALAYKDADLPLARTSSSAAPARPGVLVARRELFTQPGARRARRRHRGLRQPDATTATCTTPSTARRAARRRSSSRSAPGWSSSSSRPSASTSSATARSAPARARSASWQHEPDHRDPRQPRRRAAVDRLLRGPRRRRAATCTTTSSSRCSTTCSASRPAAAARAPGRTATGCSASTSSARTSSSARSPAAARASSPAGCGSTSTTSSPTRCFDYLVDAVRLVARDGWRLLGDYRFDPATGLWRHRDGAVEPPLRLGAITYDETGMCAPTSRPHAATESAPGPAPASTASGSCARPPSPRPHSPDLAQRRLRAPALVRPAGGGGRVRRRFHWFTSETAACARNFTHSAKFRSHSRLVDGVRTGRRQGRTLWPSGSGLTAISHRKPSGSAK